MIRNLSMLAASALVMLSSAMLDSAGANGCPWKPMQTPGPNVGIPSNLLIDSRGIRFGEQFDSVMEKLKAEGLPEIDATRSEIYVDRMACAWNGKIKGRRMRGRDYSGPTESADAHFTSPASGHQIFHLRRSFSYDGGTAWPTVKDALTALLEKYGRPSWHQVRRIDGNSASAEYIYAFNEKGRMDGIGQPELGGSGGNRVCQYASHFGEFNRALISQIDQRDLMQSPCNFVIKLDFSLFGVTAAEIEDIVANPLDPKIARYSRFSITWTDLARLRGAMADIREFDTFAKAEALKQLQTRTGGPKDRF
jgi:hypothetical protein